MQAYRAYTAFCLGWGLLTYGAPSFQLRDASKVCLEVCSRWLLLIGSSRQRSPRQGCPRECRHMRRGRRGNRRGGRFDQPPPGLLVLCDHRHIHPCIPRPQITLACNHTNRHSTQLLSSYMAHLNSHSSSRMIAKNKTPRKVNEKELICSPPILHAAAQADGGATHGCGDQPAGDKQFPGQIRRECDHVGVVTSCRNMP